MIDQIHQLEQIVYKLKVFSGVHPAHGELETRLLKYCTELENIIDQMKKQHQKQSKVNTEAFKMLHKVYQVYDKNGYCCKFSS